MSTRNEILIVPRRLYRAPNGLALAAFEDPAESLALSSLREYHVPKHMLESWRERTDDTWGPAFLWRLPGSGYGCHLYTHCAVNGQSGEETWFGFSCYAELQFFRTLMLADGIGPKSAFKVLDASPWHKIETILEQGNQGEFIRLPGIGPKTATKLLPIVFKDRPALTTTAPTIDQDAVDALLTLGVSKQQAEKRVTEQMRKHPGATTGELVKHCLKNT